MLLQLTSYISMVKVDMTENTSETEREIVNAFRGKDWDKCIKLIEITRDEAVIEERKSELVKSQQELAKRKEVLTGKVPAPAGFNPRRFRLHVPYGAIDHSYLLVTSALRDGLSSSEKLIIDIPATGETITTTVYLRNKHLAERRAI